MNTYRLILPEWHAQILADWDLEIATAGEFESVAGVTIHVRQGTRLRAMSDTGPAAELLTRMLQHHYIEEVA